MRENKMRTVDMENLFFIFPFGAAQVIVSHPHKRSGCMWMRQGCVSHTMRSLMWCQCSRRALELTTHTHTLLIRFVCISKFSILLFGSLVFRSVFHSIVCQRFAVITNALISISFSISFCRPLLVHVSVCSDYSLESTALEIACVFRRRRRSKDFPFA